MKSMKSLLGAFLALTLATAPACSYAVSFAPNVQPSHQAAVATLKANPEIQISEDIAQNPNNIALDDPGSLRLQNPGAFFGGGLNNGGSSNASWIIPVAIATGVLMVLTFGWIYSHHHHHTDSSTNYHDTDNKTSSALPGTTSGTAGQPYAGSHTNLSTMTGDSGIYGKGGQAYNGKQMPNSTATPTAPAVATSSSGMSLPPVVGEKRYNDKGELIVDDQIVGVQQNNGALAGSTYQSGYNLQNQYVGNQKLLDAVRANGGSLVVGGKRIRTNDKGELIVSDEIVNVSSNWQGEVQKLYMDMLHRTPRQDEMQAIGTFNVGEPTFNTAVVQYILQSEDYRSSHGFNGNYYSLPRDKQVQMAYRDMLNRNPNPQELNQWVSYLQSGTTPEQLYSNLLMSTEYYQR